MKYFFFSYGKTRRLVIIGVAFLCYLWLIVANAMSTFSQIGNRNSPSLWAFSGSSALISLLFLATGALVWYYARNRFVARLLFYFSCSMMVTFAVETGAKGNDVLLSLLASICSQLALFLLSALLLSFPRDYLALRLPTKTATSDSNRGARTGAKPSALTLFLRGYLSMLFLLSLVSATMGALFEVSAVFSWQLPGWLVSFVYFYNVIALLGILLTMVISYRQSRLLRERQQIRFLVIGIVVAVAPLLLLTILPTALNWPTKYVIDVRITTLSLILLPLAFGYAILRYQILAFDAHIRRTTTIVVGIVSLAILTYLVVSLVSLFLPNGMGRVIFLATVMALLAPLLWYYIRRLIERLFFSEQVHYRRLIERLDRPGREAIDLNEAAQLITQAAINALETAEACLFVRDEETGHYHLYPSVPQETGGLSEGSHSRLELSQTLVRALNPPVLVQAGMRAEQDWIRGDSAAVERLENASQPLPLSEAARGDAPLAGFARYMGSTSPLGSEPLLAPVHVQGRLIGVLALGPRGDKRQYSGPDFEAIDFILTRFAPILETARLYTQTSRHVALLDALYGASSILREAFSSVEEAARACAEIAARATQAGARIRFYDEQQQAFKRAIAVGAGPVIKEDHLFATDEADWDSWFFEGSDDYSLRDISGRMPPCLTRLSEIPHYPFAWLPLKRGQQRLGLLVLVYTRPHAFSQQERRVLEMFADQCAAAFESTRVNLELRAAYERQKELDRLKDQFIMTASHELRTPLTSVMGYLELLREYAPTLSPERLSEFIAKAHRGCDELTLMVSNIMDASHVQLDARQIKLAPVSLATSVQHILGILETVIRREQRSILVDIPPDLTVEADDLRLRQVLLNLVNNAFKYSTPGTCVEITARVDESENLVTVAIRDHGLGIPAEERHLLFERFTRLERDMNSPVRGAGLGLSICKQLVEAMGGSIRVESAGIAGEGSTFSFTLRRGQQQKRTGTDSSAASILR